MRVRAWLCYSCVAALALVLPVAAHAQTTPPLAIDAAIDKDFAAPDAGALSAGASDSGAVVAAWRDTGAGYTPVKLALWDAGTAAPGIATAGLGSRPDVAMAASGAALAAWTGSDGGLKIARRAPGADAFAAPQSIAPPPQDSPPQPNGWGDPAVAIRPDGSGVVALGACRFFGSHNGYFLYVVDVAADGTVSAAQSTGIDVSGMILCNQAPATYGAARAAAGPDGQVAATLCVSAYCQLATRATTGGGWSFNGVDGTSYAPSTAGAVPVITAQGKVVVSWLSTSSPAKVMAAIGTAANSMSQLGAISDAATDARAGELLPLGGDALALWQQAVAGGHAIVARPIFGAGSLGALTTLRPVTVQGAAPYADPHGAAWSDGVAVAAFADQPSAGVVPALALQRRAIGGALTDMTTTQLPDRTVTLPRVALAGDSAHPLGLVATREDPAGDAPATVVLRRIDGVAPGLTAVVPASATAGTPVAMTASAVDVSAPVRVRFDFGDGTAGEGASVQHTYAAAGARTVTVTATDAAQNTATATATIQVAPGPGSGGATPGDGAAPVPSGARLAPKRFRPGRRNTALVAAKRRRAPVGSTLRLTLSKPATVAIDVIRIRTGRRVGTRCKLGARRGRRCTRRTTVVRLRRTLPAGASAVAFTGRFRGRALATGRYTLRLVATDAAGRRSAPASAAFTIAR